jgi:phage terminase large subunit
MDVETRQINAGFPPKLIHPLFESRCRTIVLYGGRAGGKSWAVARALLIRGVYGRLRVLCAREYMSSISDSVHKLLSNQIEELGLTDHYTIEKATIFAKNGTEFRFGGIRNNPIGLKSYEAIDICWVEEAENVSKESWQVLIPTIRKPGSQIIVTFNPSMLNSETYQRYVVNPPPNCCSVKINYLDNPFITDTPFGKEVLAEADYMKATDPDAYLNVWLGHPKIILDNAIYAKELRQAQEDNRICEVPYDRTVPCNTYWDLGMADRCSIIIAQVVAMQFRVIDYIEDSGKPIHDYIRMLQDKPYIYGTDYLPHDAKARQLGTGRSIEEVMRLSGRKVSIVPRLSVNDGINAARTLFPSIWIDERKCSQLLICLQRYAWDVEASNPKPKHDESSHGADAFRYMAIVIKPPKVVRPYNQPHIIPRQAGWMS